MKLLHIPLKVDLRQLSVFEIGTNQPLINKGAMQFHASSVLPEKLDALLSTFNGEDIALAIPGYLLKLLDEESPETISSLQDFVQANKAKLYGVPYYGTSLEVMDTKEFSQQVKLEEESIHHYFQTSLSGFYVGNQGISSELKLELQKMSLPILAMDSEHHLVAKTSEDNADLSEVTGEFSTLINAKGTDHELGEHVQTELKELYPHIIASNDTQLLENWRLLSQTDHFTQLNHDESAYAYDNYMTMMNILNDVTHQLRSVQLAKEGEFLHNVSIVDSPSTLLKVN